MMSSLKLFSLERSICGWLHEARRRASVLVPVMVEMWAQPITSELCRFLFQWHVVVEYPDHCAGLAGNQVLFEKKDSEELGETTMLQARLHPSQKTFFDLLGARKSHPPLHTVNCNSDLRMKPSIGMTIALSIFVHRSRFAWSFALDHETWPLFVHCY